MHNDLGFADLWPLDHSSRMCCRSMGYPYLYLQNIAASLSELYLEISKLFSLARFRCLVAHSSNEAEDGILAYALASL